MLDRLRSFFSGLADAAREKELRHDDPRVAAAALMFHVIDADGVRDAEEKRRLREALAESYAISGDELNRVVSAGEAAEREAIDLFAFTSILNRNLDEAAKIDLIEILWEMVYADGELHELEDNVVWRAAELIGVSPRERMMARQRVRGTTAQEQDRDA